MYSLVAVSAELAEQLVAIENAGDDAVHQARTRVRRLRSILSAYRAAFDPEAQTLLRDRLEDLGARLGTVRDLEVRALAMENLLGAETAPEVVDAVEAMAADLRRSYESERQALLRHLGTKGHRRLVADVQAFAASPPLSADGGRHPRRIARRGLRKARRRVLGGSVATLAERHETRKAARRLRYAAEAVTDDFGREAVRLASAGEALQDLLGDNRDLILLAVYLRERLEGGGLGPSAIAGIGRLAAETDRRADDLLTAVEERMEAVADARLG
ncbi:CHAD domain-containing protein [Leifsonia sp. AG29]|uniref:CHAD domain-containing protein n=1 Tax=Leifsonia sp. AG29 TaxID=2598860 RepID=UPI00131C87AC|nr:CHAD domain-containing protein [Leifsonia sp. AG29]